MLLKKESVEKLYAELEEKEVDGEIQYFKKRRVYPIVKKDGTMNWFNFLTGGTWWKLAVILFIVLVTVGFIFEYSTNLKIGAECIARENLLKDFTAVKFP